MTTEQSLAASALHAWKLNVDRADKFFSPLTDQQLLQPIAPGKNRLVYLWGHLIAVHDGMLPLLGIGPRLHPELDAAFLTGADGSAADVPSAGDLKRCWEDVHAALLAGLTSFTPTQWTEQHTAVSADDFAANPLRNRCSVLLSRTTHIGYHLGQCVLAPV